MEVLRARCNGQRCGLPRALDIGMSLTKVEDSKRGVIKIAVSAQTKCIDFWYEAMRLKKGEA